MTFRIKTRDARLRTGESVSEMLKLTMLLILMYAVKTALCLSVRI